jgi:hypothetical protein
MVKPGSSSLNEAPLTPQGLLTQDGPTSWVYEPLSE